MTLPEFLRKMSAHDLALAYHDLYAWYNSEVFGYPIDGWARDILLQFKIQDSILGLSSLFHCICVEIASRTITNLEYEDC